MYIHGLGNPLLCYSSVTSRHNIRNRFNHFWNCDISVVREVFIFETDVATLKASNLAANHGLWRSTIDNLSCVRPLKKKNGIALWIVISSILSTFIKHVLLWAKLNYSLLETHCLLENNINSFVSISLYLKFQNLLVSKLIIRCCWSGSPNCLHLGLDNNVQLIL